MSNHGEEVRRFRPGAAVAPRITDRATGGARPPTCYQGLPRTPF